MLALAGLIDPGAPAWVQISQVDDVLGEHP
jgi:hypothetical protein